MLEAEDVGLVADRLIVDEDAVLDQIPALGLHALVVITDRAERMLRDDGDLVATPLEGLRFPLVERGETRAGIVGLVTEHPIEFGRMTDRFVDRQPEMAGVEHSFSRACFAAAAASSSMS